MTTATAKPKKSAKKVAKVAKPAAEKELHLDEGAMTDCKTGSTRLRLFRALGKYKSLSAKEIKEKTGMLPNSGHLAVLLGEEIEKGRITYEQHDIDGRDTFVYKLTPAGAKDLANRTVDRRKAGVRIGQKWTKARSNFEKSAPKSSKAKPKKAAKAKATAKKPSKPKAKKEPAAATA